MKVRSTKISKSIIFYIAWIMMVIHICIANSSMQEYSSSTISYIAMALFCIKIVIQKNYNLRELVLIICLCFFSYCSYKASDDMRVLWFAIVLVASKEIEFDRAVKYSFWTILICCIVFFGCYKVGISQQTLVNSVRGVRSGFGLGHPNMCSAYYSILMILYVYLKFDFIKIRKLVILAIGSFAIYYFTKSITGFIVSILALIIVFVLKYMPLKRINLRIIILGLLIGILAFTILPIIYDSRFVELDTLLTGRIHQANFYFHKYGISFFGNNVNADLLSEYRDNILDIGYAKMLINDGVFFYCCVVFGYMISLIWACKEGKRSLVALMSCFIIYMFTENVATYIFMNVTMLLFSEILYKGHGERGKQDIYEHDNS